MLMLSVVALMVDAARVVEIRLRMMTEGRSTTDEMLLMLTEKINAAGAASAIIVGGGSPALVIDHYQKIVSANVARLSSTQPV